MAGVALDPESVSVVPGTTGSCSVRVRNTGVVVDAFSVTVLGDAASWTTAIPAQLSLFPGADGTIELLFAPPRTSNLPAGPLPFGVRVQASQDPDNSVVEEGTVTVGSFREFNAKITPRTSEGKRSTRHEVLVDNRGNTAIEVELAASDPDEQLAFEVRPQTLTVEPGETARAAVKVAARKGFAKGIDRHRQFNVTVTGGPGDPPVLLDAAMVQKAGMPRFIFPLVAGVVALALIAVVLPGVMKSKDRSGTIKLANDTATSTTVADDGSGDAAASADAAAKAAAESEAAAAAEKAANGKDEGGATVTTAPASNTAPSGGAVAAGTGAAAGTSAGAATPPGESPGVTAPPAGVATTTSAPAAATTTTSTTVPSRTGAVRGTYSFDFDAGVESSSGADAFWQQATSTSRSLIPVNGAAFSRMGAVDYNSVTLAKLQSLSYSTGAIDGSDGTSTLAPGMVLGVRTTNGKYAKVRIDSKEPYPANTLHFTFYTYP